MSSSERELEEQLTEAGNRVVDPPASVEELLPLLDEVENCLSRVEQSPSKSMQSALSPSLKALVADKLLRHSNVDVKVAVAACVSEITRITAPDAPYDDDQMKEVFQLIVSSFENLSDKSSRSYTKRTSILETVAKVRSCVVMLDLECDALILEMFQHFLKAIRDYHPENVFTSMETIMTLVLEESEDISPELLSPILASVKRNNEEVLPIARKLGERVLETCAIKLKPYLVEAVKSLGISLEDYSKVVASICQDTSGSVELNDAQAASEHMVDNELTTEPASPERVDTAIDKSPNSVMSNGITLTEGGETLVDSDSSKKQEHGHCTDQSKSSNTSSNAEPDSLEIEKLVNTECKPEQTTNRRGGSKPPSSMKLTDPSGGSGTDGDEEAEKSPDNLKSLSKDIPSSPQDDLPVEAAVASVNEKETDIQLTSPKAPEGESVNVGSPSSGGNLPDESHSKKAGRPKRKENLIKEVTPSADEVSQKPSEGTSDSEVKPHTRMGKRVPAGISNEDKSLTTVNASKKESGTMSDSEAKPLKQSAKKVVASNNNRDGSSIKQPEDKKRRGWGKAISERDVAKSSAKDDDKEMVSSPKSTAKSTKDEPLSQETSKTNSKRKRIPGKEKESDIQDFGEDLVGSKVKVWWPKDHMFYEGVVDSFDPVKKKHKVLYTDGDEEILNLKKERWELIGDDSGSDGGPAADHPSPDASSEMPQKKKVKTNSDASTKQGKINASPKRGGGASSSKSKGAGTKSARKLRDGSQVDGKSKDDSKTGSKPEDDNGGKTKDLTSKSGSKSASKSKDEGTVARKASKSKDDDSNVPKTPAKSRQETSKTAKSKPVTTKIAAGKSKGKSPKSGGKSNANGSGKVKSGSSKVKESEDVKENSSDSEKTPESVRGKLADSSKSHGSETKTGKKRRRGAKS